MRINTKYGLGLAVLVALLTSPASFAVEGSSGDPAKGEANALICSGCHGQDGHSTIDPSYAKLAGQNEKYLYNQLSMIRDDERKIALMTGILTGKSDQDLRDLAAYFANLPADTDRVADLNETQVLRAEEIYRGGIADRAVAACAACHGPRGNGNRFAGFPSIAGQSAEYTVNQLTAYREQQRGSSDGASGMMWGVARGLTDGDIQILAQYIQGLN
ncbi:MAG: c-type cytochrome [Pseudomonadota bacterium]